MPEPISCDAVQALRAATRAVHEQLDQLLPISSPDATVHDYAVHLSVLRDWQVALQPWLVQGNANPADLSLIAQDLEDCRNSGVAFDDAEAVDVSAIQQADDHTEAFRWGVSYVLEGSRLGGQVLYRRLQQQLAPHPLRYFGQRVASGLSWPEFLQELAPHLPDEASRQSACKGAVTAFDVLLQRFRHIGCVA